MSVRVGFVLWMRRGVDTGEGGVSAIVGREVVYGRDEFVPFSRKVDTNYVVSLTQVVQAMVPSTVPLLSFDPPAPTAASSG